MRSREEKHVSEKNYLRSNLKTLNQFVFEFRTVYKLEHEGVNKRKLSKKIFIEKTEKHRRKDIFCMSQNT